MANDIFRRLLLVVVLCLLQVFVFNRIHLFECATPLLYVILPLQFSTAQPRWSALLWCFVMGLVVDVFSNTPGLAAASLTLIGMLQPYLLPAFISREEETAFEPSLKSLGWLKFTAYASIIVFIYCLVFFTIETFSFSDFLLWIENVGGSTAITLILIVALEKILR